jgi:AcrR family transcriptional regulator
MPATPSRRRLRLTELRCREILDAARLVFAARGFDAATVDEVAARAGVAKGTLYLYYPSKRDIYWAALRDGVRELHVLLTARLAAADTCGGVIRAFVETKVTYFDEHADFFRIVHAEFGRAAQPVRQRGPALRTLINEQVDLLATALARVSGRGRPRLPHEDVAFAVAAITRGLVVRRLTSARGRHAAACPTVAADVALVLQLLLPGIEGASRAGAPAAPRRSTRRPSRRVPAESVAE